jgi:hypothetical protein
MDMKIVEIQQPKFSNWVFPKPGTLQADFEEYKKKETKKWKARAESMGFRFPIFNTFEDFVSALKSAKVITLTSGHDRQIMNRSHTSNLKDLKSLVNGYNTPRDVDRIVNGYNTDAPMPYPIVLRGTKGEWIMAGNTRLDTAFIMGITPKVLLVDVSNKNVNESSEPNSFKLPQLKEMLDAVREEVEYVSDGSMNFDADSKEWKAAEKDTQALAAIEAVIENNIAAIKKNLLDNNIFLYDYYEGDSIDSGIAAIHVQVNGDLADVKWIGSYSTHAAPLFKQALAIAKTKGARRVTVDAKWNSAGFYRKMGLDQGEAGEYNPISGSSLTSFTGNL